MKNITNDQLIIAYEKACELKLDKDFQSMLKSEINWREIKLSASYKES